MNLEAKIESVLFWKGEPMPVKKLAKILNVSEEEIAAGLEKLDKILEGRGVELVRKEDEVMLGTRAEIGPLIETLTKEELVKDLGKAGLETLAIIIYRAPVARRDIDYIRGVNSQFIVRNLLVRGLIEKVQNPEDQRSFYYKPTFELLSYLGVGALEKLPEYETMRKELASAAESEQNHE